MKYLITLLLIFTLTTCYLPDNEKASTPGMVNEKTYSGYLNTKVEGRKIHYVFVEARKNSDKAPLTIWFNGGPGCSSLIGYLQEIGPYLVGNDFELGENLTRNQYSWNEESNLLFLESPALVGFSTDTDKTFVYNDTQTADDAFEAILHFFKKAPEFWLRKAYLAGESYAGKYIPDVAARIIEYNRDTKEQSEVINLLGLLVGNGVMNFVDNSIEKSEIEYMIEHDFVDDRLQGIYRDACKKNFNSPRCEYFKYELELDEDNVNPYNVYEFCKEAKSAQTIRMMETIRKMSSINKRKLNRGDLRGESESIKLEVINECPNDNGAIKYFNLTRAAFNIDGKLNKTWEPCADILYERDDNGSMEQYRNLFLNPAIKIWFFNGDWDDVVPYRDTEKNLDLLGKEKKDEWEIWDVDGHHAGFFQDYSERLTVISVKGASHMVPQTKPKQAYQIFVNFINNRPVTYPVVF